ncbi:3'(2'),5'-bisphosphate nucleotidase CysQ [Austwickia sp. TVS 96-490-7B]|uniref:inositol monophosphatase family protein n=1 Tax=Austwickia sp. TVS 96-490-7B TaxID=2830843 RepID=UPI001D3290DB|nr:inositol monophosphatase family protein [Austwickia sp. TVS 96-490-7B]MBW3086152.1 3'(2'),5'-bisphosphate nucleotidase CysQ [Austwickia sp. TVS 96-490-7B]
MSDPAEWMPWTREVPADVAGCVGVDLVELRQLAVELAIDGALLARDGRGAALARAGAVDTKSTQTDVVTVMDRAVEERLRGRLAVARPQDAVLGEEAGQHGRSSLTWVLDPIDGTVNYVYGREEYGVSVAAVLGDPAIPGRWVTVAGAVAAPARGVVFHAHRGGGARCDEIGTVRGDMGGVGAEASGTLSVTSVDDLAVTLLATGFAYDSDRRVEQAQALVPVLGQVRDIRRGGSAALDLCAVAAGTVDAYAERGVHVWDVAAGMLIAAEAGAQVGFWIAGPRAETGVMAASPGISAPLAALMTQAYLDASHPVEMGEGRVG